MKKELLFDSRNSRTFKYFADCLNMFIPHFLNHNKYKFNGTQNVSSKKIKVKNNKVYVVWQPHFNAPPNARGYSNRFEDDNNKNVIIVTNNKQNMKFSDNPMIVFANEKRGGGYRFLGVYRINKENSKPRKQYFNKVADVADFTQNPPIVYYNTDIEDIERNTEELAGKEKEALVKIRINQSTFRKNLLEKYKKCCLCGINNPSLLIASHIKPWSQSDENEKLDIDNGLLLCPNHDKLFDLGLISFDKTGKIKISKQLSKNYKSLLKISNKTYIDINEKKKKYLKYHRENIFNK